MWGAAKQVSQASTPAGAAGDAERTTTRLPRLGQLIRQRGQFKHLLLSNPNYFGNLKVSEFQPVLTIQGDTTFEELGCVGLQTQLNTLEAVVYVKQPSGYSGDVCSSGSQEYVRFYLSFDNGLTWQDQGLTSFTAYDIPSAAEQRLEYAVSLFIDPQKLLCFVDNLPLARAILSWNYAPPANTPDFTPIWGNVKDAHVQIDALKWILLKDAFAALQVKLPAQLEEALDLTQPVPAAKPKTLSVVELQALYKGKGIPEHRFLFSHIQQVLASPALNIALGSGSSTGLLKELNVDLADLIAKLLATDGDTRFEQLACVGLNPNLSLLEGVVTVKLPNGYSGNLCAAGSQEYVAFWADWDLNGTWSYVGTASVAVHDINAIPAGGLEYAVFLPVDLSAHQQPCEQGPKTSRVRAILSWETQPPPGNPDYVPTWGNREETLVQIPAGVPATPGNYTPYLESVGGVAICDIDQTTGLTNADARPFGATISITGYIPGPPDVGATALKYSVYVRELATNAVQQLTNAFGVSVVEQIGTPTPIAYDTTQTVDADGFYTYLEDPNPAGAGWRLVQDRLLAQWITAQPMTGLWQVEIKAKDPVTNTIYDAGTITCQADGTTRKYVKVLLDELPPKAQLQITHYTRGGGPLQPAEDCGQFLVGDVISGTYTATDPDGHFGWFLMDLEPSTSTHGTTVNPSFRAYPVVSTNGETSTWTLDTHLMDPCGYTIRLEVRDRTIIDDSAIGWEADDYKGFCLEAAPVNPS